jgi:hypothetical protein
MRTRARLGTVLAALLVAAAMPTAAGAATTTLIGTSTTYLGTGANLQGLKINWQLYRTTGTGYCADYSVNGVVTWANAPQTGDYLAGPDLDTFELNLQLPSGYVIKSTSASGTLYSALSKKSYVYTPTLIDSSTGLPAWKFREQYGQLVDGWLPYKGWLKSANFSVRLIKSNNCATSTSKYLDLAVKGRYIRTVDSLTQNWSISVGAGVPPVSVSVSVTPTTGTATLNPSSWSTWLVP